ncbi:DNA-binding protein [Streptomyces sp. HSW2009]|uniref:nSTAND1 domain-containing NTPase n=1 Tax=Streptomyces sp. HSW2009 TaxID=3142890 RepID=UPI0032EC8856
MLRRDAGGPTYREMARSAGYSATSLSQAASGEQLPSLAVALAYVRACDGDQDEWQRRWQEAAQEVPDREEEDADAPSPYQGLDRFEPGDHERFFGRTALVAELCELMLAQRFAAVFGPSGSGKSSLLRAGLVPALRTAEGPPAAIRILTPGEHPMRSHARALRPQGTAGHTVVVVDQFEEVFTLCRDPDERAEFLAALLTARQPDSRLRVVIAVRADFYGRCAEHQALADALRDANLLVGPMSPAELREVIVRPAQLAGLIVERELTARLVEEVGREPGGLPLLSHCLRETWRRRRGRVLTVQAYEAAGRVHGAIAKTAEEVYAGFSADQAELARLILLRLITPGEGSPDTRRPLDRTELSFAPADEVALVLDHLARARLIILDENTVDLVHEALITSWPRLHAWVEEARERLHVHRRLTEAAHAWVDLDRDAGALYRGTRLAMADEHLVGEPLTPMEQEFLSAGRTTRSRELRHRRALLAVLATLLVLALIAGAAAWQQSRTGERRHRESEAQRIAAMADSLHPTDPVTAARLSVAAWRLAPTVETRSAVLAALNTRERDVFRVPERDARSTVRRITGNGRTLVSASGDHVRVWDLRTHRLTHVYPGPGERLSGPDEDVISPDGRTLVLGSEDTLRVWDIRAGRMVATLPTEQPVTAAFSGDGRSLVTSGAREVQVWDVATLRLRLRVPVGGGDGGASYSAISTDGRRLAECSAQHPLRIWDVARHTPLDLPWTAKYGWGSCSRSRLTFSPDNATLVFDGPGGMRVLDVASGRELAARGAEEQADMRFSPDGTFMTSVNEEGHVLMWRFALPNITPVFRHTLKNQTADHYEIDFAAGVIRYLDSSRTDVRSLALGQVTTAGWRRWPTDAALFSRDGQTLATLRAPRKAVGERNLTLWDTRTGRSLLTMPEQPCPVDSADPEAASDGSQAQEPRASEEKLTVDGADLDAPSEGVEDVDCINAMALSADGRFFAYARSSTAPDASAGQRITVWDVSARRRSASIVIRPDRDDMTSVHSLAMSPDGRTLYVARSGAREDVEVWDVPRNKRLRTLRNTPVTGLALRGDQHLLVTGQGQVTNPCTAQTHYRALGDDIADVLAFSPDGARFAAGDARGHVSVWNGGVRDRLGVMGTTPGEAVTALAFSPDGNTLAVAGSDGTVQLWDVASSRPLGSPLPTPGDLPRALAFNQNGTVLYVAGSHVRVRAYDIAPAEAARQVCTRAGSGLSRADWKKYLPGIPYRRTC